MKIKFTDIARINKTAFKYVLIEILSPYRYRLYFGNKQPQEAGFYPRHPIRDAIFLPVSEAREQLKESNELEQFER